MTGKKSARRVLRLMREGEMDCDTALEHHLHNYRGEFDILSISKAHLALCSANMGWTDRVLDLRGGLMTVAEIIKEFDLELFLPLFDEQEDAKYRKGDVVRFDAWVCRVVGRRRTTPFAVHEGGTWELFLEAIDGEMFGGAIGEGEVHAVHEGEPEGPVDYHRIDYMRFPSFSQLEKMRAEGRCRRSSPQNLHPSPRSYKYYWWVFFKDSKVEGEAFLSPEYRISTAAAMKLMRRLADEKEPCMVYNALLPRKDSSLDPNDYKWKDAEWAPAFDDDPDEIWEGHK